RLQRAALLPERLDAFIHLLKRELGYQLHESVKRTKFDLSVRTETTFDFHCDPISISKKVTRQDFEKWIQPELVMIAECVDRLIKTAGISANEIDHVFLTGGSSFVPAVRQLFVDRFGLGKMRG